MATTALASARASWEAASRPVVGWPQCYYRWPVTRLRAEHVFPRIAAFIKACPKPVSIFCPISRRNVGEFAALKDYWLCRGARGVNPQPL